MGILENNSDLTYDYEKEIESFIEELCSNSRFLQTKEHIQHGNITVYEHCIAVAYMSCYIATRFHLPVNYSNLIRGALLHDYFLYDWHNPSHGHFHGFTHAKKALENASKDFTLTPLEENIILRHMFPLTIIPPSYLEGWIVCLADKICATRESFFDQKKA